MSGSDPNRLPGPRWPGLLALGMALSTALATGGGPGVAATPGPAATVQEILDGNQLYIEQRQARVRDGARVPDRLRTGNSRAQLGFLAGGTARINRFSQLKLGPSCFFLTKGQVLVSGPQNGCTRSSRLSVRGTNYLLSLSETGAAELTVLEGKVLVEALSQGVIPAQARPTAVFGGNRVNLAADGSVSDRRRLSEAELAALLNGPLFQGFLSPLSAQQGLQNFLQRAYPNLNSSLAPSATDPSASALQDAVNALRQQQGRPPFQALPAELAARNRAYLKPVLHNILAGTSGCDHDRSRWRTFQASLSTAGLRPSSEVLTCGPLRSWDPQRVVAEWSSSALHRSILLERPRATSLGCSTLNQGEQIVAFCTLWTPNR